MIGRRLLLLGAAAAIFAAGEAAAGPRRRSAARRAFLRQSGYPGGRPGYVVDHIEPLCAGGLDGPANMQWLTIGEARAKDQVERARCRRARR